MSSWAELYRAHATGRRPESAWTGEVRKRLTKLAKGGHCEPSIPHRFTNKCLGKINEWSIRGQQQPSTGAPLANIRGMRSATLDVLAIVAQSGQLHQFDIRAEGERDDQSRWVIAVHLSDDRGGAGDRHGFGACGHAAFHCHVGPNLDDVPKVRVPLPAVGPVDALDWVLSQLVPTPEFEPAPWASVTAETKKAPR